MAIHQIDLNNNLIKIWDCGVREIAKQLGHPDQSGKISQVISGKRKSIWGFIFKTGPASKLDALDTPPASIVPGHTSENDGHSPKTDGHSEEKWAQMGTPPKVETRSIKSKASVYYPPEPDRNIFNKAVEDELAALNLGEPDESKPLSRAVVGKYNLIIIDPDDGKTVSTFNTPYRAVRFFRPKITQEQFNHYVKWIIASCLDLVQPKAVLNTPDGEEYPYCFKFKWTGTEETLKSFLH